MHVTHPRSLVLVGCVLLSTGGAAQPTAFPSTDLATGLSLTGQVIAGDFNGDGNPDLLLASHSLSENYGIYVMFGGGDGTFAPPSHVRSPPFGTSLGAADFTGDGNLDVMVETGGELWVLPGAGDGTFGAPRISTSTPSGSRPLIVDLDRDANLDVVLADPDDGILVALGNGDGTVRPAMLVRLGARVARVAAGDIDSDGNLDLLAANIGLPDTFDGSTVTLLFGYGDGAFRRGGDVPVGMTPSSLAVLDVNGDGRLDIAASSYATAVLSVAAGNGDGSFGPTAHYPTPGPGTADTVAADFNGDGRPDLAVCGTPVLSVFVNAGGTFSAHTDVPAASSCNSIAVADFDRDGAPDVALNYFAGSGTVSIFLNAMSRTDSVPPTVTIAATPSALWPPNGRMVGVAVSGTITDVGSGVDPATLAFAVIDEYGIVQPAAPVAVDAGGRYAFSVSLAASRRGDDRDGRAYTIIVRGADRAGNESSAALVVVVAHDSRRRSPQLR